MDSVWNDRASPVAESLRSNGSSTAVTTGLGISMGSLTPRLRRPRSFDEESLKPRGWSFDSGSVASTAPLLPSRSFVDWTPVTNRRGRGGLGSWERGRTPNLNNGEGEREGDGTNALTESWNDAPPGVGGIAGVLESVQAVVEFIAGRLAKMGSDEVTNGAEWSAASCQGCRTPEIGGRVWRMLTWLSDELIVIRQRAEAGERNLHLR
jgi:hypothetical protein